MPNSTRNRPRRRRLGRRTLMALCAAAAVSLGAAAAALGDGDPASDVLASQPVFIPGDAGVSAVRQRQLTDLVAEAARAGFPVRVAIVAGAADLGSVTELWRMPGAYARFLGQELSLVFRGTLLVVMPQGFGVVPVGAGDATTGASGVPGSGPVRGSLGTGAIGAVLSLARSAGHRLTLPAAGAGAPGAAALDSVDFGSWVALAAGAVLIGLAWASSLRARPISSRRSTS